MALRAFEGFAAHARRPPDVVHDGVGARVRERRGHAADAAQRATRGSTPAVRRRRGGTAVHWRRRCGVSCSTRPAAAAGACRRGSAADAADAAAVGRAQFREEFVAFVQRYGHSASGAHRPCAPGDALVVLPCPSGLQCNLLVGAVVGGEATYARDTARALASRTHCGLQRSDQSSEACICIPLLSDTPRHVEGAVRAALEACRSESYEGPAPCRRFLIHASTDSAAAALAAALYASSRPRPWP